MAPVGFVRVGLDALTVMFWVAGRFPRRWATASGLPCTAPSSRGRQHVAGFQRCPGRADRVVAVGDRVAEKRDPGALPARPGPVGGTIQGRPTHRSARGVRSRSAVLWLLPRIDRAADGKVLAEAVSAAVFPRVVGM